MSQPAAATKTRRAAALPPDERRSMIVAATLPLLLEHGDRVTTKQIAEAAGIAEGTIFRVFADKDEVIAAVIEAALDPEPLEAALAAIPAGLGVRGPPRGGDRHHAAAGHRHLAARVERRHPLPRDDPAPDGRQRRARAHVRREPRADRGRADRRGTAAARAHLSMTHPMLAGEPMSPDELVQLFLHGVGGKGRPPC